MSGGGESAKSHYRLPVRLLGEVTFARSFPGPPHWAFLPLLAFHCLHPCLPISCQETVLCPQAPAWPLMRRPPRSPQGPELSHAPCLCVVRPSCWACLPSFLTQQTDHHLEYQLDRPVLGECSLAASSHPQKEPGLPPSVSPEWLAGAGHP